MARLAAARKPILSVTLAILLAMADELMARQDAILEANAKDLARAQENGLSKAMIDRLTLDPKRRYICANSRPM